MKDLIDFPCSADWLDYYHERGLTPRSSGRPSKFESIILKKIEEIERQIAEQQAVIIELLQYIKNMNMRKQRQIPQSQLALDDLVNDPLLKRKGQRNADSQ